MDKALLLAEAEYDAFKSALSRCSWFFENGRTLFVLALGSHRSGAFDAISRNSQISIVWRGSYLPLWARPIGFISAAYGGIVQVSGMEGLEIVVDNLLCMACLQFMSVRSECTESVSGLLRELGRHANAFDLTESQTLGVLSAFWVDDDSIGDYRLGYCQGEGPVCPLILERKPA